MNPSNPIHMTFPALRGRRKKKRKKSIPSIHSASIRGFCGQITIFWTWFLGFIIYGNVVQSPLDSFSISRNYDSSIVIDNLFSIGLINCLRGVAMRRGTYLHERRGCGTWTFGPIFVLPMHTQAKRIPIIENSSL